MYPPMYPPFGSVAPCGPGYGALVAYGTLALTDASPPQSFADVLTPEDLVGYLRLPASFLSNPAMVDELGAMIAAAREQAEIGQGRDLVVKQWDLVQDYWLQYRIELRSPLVSVDLAQYRDSGGQVHSLIEGTDFMVDRSKQPAALAPMYNKTWPPFTPWPSSAVLIRYTSGMSPGSPWWSDAGNRVKIGMRMLIKTWFQKESPTDAQAAFIDKLLSQGGIPRAR